MLTRCLFCHRPFPANDRFVRARPGRSFAFDPERGRLWVVCDRCHRWTLQPLESRFEALVELERAARDRATPVAHTGNVALLQLDEVTLLRVGRAPLVERAWWRYGRELQRRKRTFEGATSRITAYTLGAVRLVGEVLGLADPDVDITWDDAPVEDLLRWRHFGWAAWHGRTDCPYCGSTLRALRYDLSWWVYPLEGEAGGLRVGVPCQRCDPWTPENLYVIDGSDAETVLRRCLAYQNIAGAPANAVKDAARVIEDAGSAGAFTVSAASRRESLWKMGRTRGLALEIALSESVEERLLSLEARALEFIWRREEELAGIIDTELSARGRFRARLDRLKSLSEDGEPRVLRRLRPDPEGAG